MVGSANPVVGFSVHRGIITPPPVALWLVLELLMIGLPEPEEVLVLRLGLGLRLGSVLLVLVLTYRSDEAVFLRDCLDEGPSTNACECRRLVQVRSGREHKYYLTYHLGPDPYQVVISVPCRQFQFLLLHLILTQHSNEKAQAK